MTSTRRAEVAFCFVFNAHSLWRPPSTFIFASSRFHFFFHCIACIHHHCHLFTFITIFFFVLFCKLLSSRSVHKFASSLFFTNWIFFEVSDDCKSYHSQVDSSDLSVVPLISILTDFSGKCVSTASLISMFRFLSILV